MRSLLLTLLLAASAAAALPSISDKTKDMQPMPGFFPIYWDQAAGKIWLQVDKLDTEFLYLDSLPAGVGSNDIGLDRGQAGAAKVVRFERFGPKLLLVQPNQDYRSSSTDAHERRTVEESFAKSVLWGFDIQAEQGSAVLIDATAFFLEDAHGVAATLQRTGQGSYKLDASRSALQRDRTRNFPRNTEVEALLTFTGEPKGDWIRSVTPSPEAVTVRQHQSLIALPEPGYRPRAFDPRAGFAPIDFMDFSVPLGDPVRQRYIPRHRLQKREPDQTVSDPVRPIVYYVDRGTPEPIRTALLEGASWWNAAFTAAGYRDAFQVALLPEDADPMDIRYNVIQWVHRATRGWSYGNSIVDPRTGEILKGQVTLGSLRGRQDYLIFEGLLAPYENGQPAPAILEQSVLARLRQLAAHEVGHTLGLVHNYASSVNNRASVMDYPHPLIRLRPDRTLDLSDAYANGIGEWDKTAIAYGYREFGEGTNEKAGLDAVLSAAIRSGLLFLTDADARPLGSVSPVAHLWDNGTDAATALTELMAIRAAALERFSEKVIRPGAPLSTLEDALVPVYLLHRYQTEAAAKMIGGSHYSFALRGDGQTIVQPVSAEAQQAALKALLNTIDPQALTLPERILKLLPPPAHGYDRTREHFKGVTGLAFDPLAAASSASNLTASLLLHPERAARLEQQHARDPKLPGLGQVIDALLASTWLSPSRAGLPGAVQATIRSAVLFHLITLASDSTVPDPVKAVAVAKLQALAATLERTSTTADAPQRSLAAKQIRAFLRDPKQIDLAKPAPAPPGQPIGCEPEW